MRAVPAYLVLVGVPLAVLVPLLQAGRKLEAPPAVAGVWHDSAGTTLHLAQSGIFVSLVVEPSGQPRRVQVARLNGRALTVDSFCGGDSGARLEFGPGARPSTARAVCGTAAVGLTRATAD